MKEAVRVLTRDGVKISATWFIADHPDEKVVLINSATGVKQSFYQHFAAFLAQRGFNVYTYDYRGIGASCSADKAYLQSNMKDWSKDMDAMIGHITATHPQSQLVIIGHSIGGQLIGMSRMSGYADSLIMIGAQTPYWKNYEGIGVRLKLRFFWYFLIPLLTRLFGYFPASKLRLFEDLPANVALQWARWAKSPAYVFKDNPELKSSFEALDQRSLFISFSDDDLAPHKAVLDLKRFFTQAKIDHWHVHPEDILVKKIGHFGFFKKHMEMLMWNDMIRWIGTTITLDRSKAA
jgi:predicted alpha/beta hydrolase